MPWWFWPLAVLWSIPLLGIVALVVAVVREVKRDRRMARAEADAERRAAELASHPRPHATVDPLDAQRFNPSVHGRPDQWRAN